MFNALGKSKPPLYLLIFSSVLNMILDVVFVTRLDMGVAGVAWATLIAQGISCILSFLLFWKELAAFPTEKIRPFFSKEECRLSAGIAFPSILQQSTVSIGMMLVQAVVNSFGSEALAGFSAAMRIESICVVPMSAMGNAVSSYTAQNLGAGRQDRVVRGYHAGGYGMVALFAVIICVIIECFHTPLIALFLGEDGTRTALETGTGYLSFMGWFFIMIGLKMSTDGVLRGSGDMKMFTVANLVNLGIRVSVAWIAAPRFGIQWVWMAVPMGWTANYLISYREYRTGKWREKAAAG